MHRSAALIASYVMFGSSEIEYALHASLRLTSAFSNRSKSVQKRLGLIYSTFLCYRCIKNWIWGAGV